MQGICYLIGIALIFIGIYMGANKWPSPYDLDSIIELKRTLAIYFYASGILGGSLFIALGEVLRKLEILITVSQPRVDQPEEPVPTADNEAGPLPSETP